jgi:NAD(P)H-flavin reductase
MASAAEKAPLPRAAPMVPDRFRVIDKLQETDDTWTLALEPLDRAGPLEFDAGQFNMVYAFGAGEVPISISGDPDRPDRLVHTVRAVGATSEAVCAASPGDVLGIRGPFGSSWPLGQARGLDILVIAGGIGLAPLRPVVYELLSRKDEYKRALLLYGGREPKQLLFRDELEEWVTGHQLEVEVTVDIASGRWDGHVGVVPALIAEASFDPTYAVAFICGPEVMIRFTATALVDRGVDPDRIYVSMERNMKCAIGHCGHCQFGPEFVCRDGPIFSMEHIEHFFNLREV